MAVEMDIIYKGDLLCEATHCPSGKIIETDAPVDNGGKGSAFSPTDLASAALGACIVTIMGLTAKKRGIDIDGTKVRVVKEMAQSPVRRIAKLSVDIKLPKEKKYSDEDVELFKKVAEMCPVKQSLHPDIRIEINIS